MDKADTVSGGIDDRAGRKASQMTFIAWLAQNVAIGLTFGGYGTLITTFERSFGVDRSVSALGISLVLLALSLIAPIIGILLGRVSIRFLMTTGALLSAAGYVSLTQASSMSAVLLIYGLLVGPGTALLGAMLPSALVSGWYEEGRGRALGLVNMPILVAVVPPVSSWILLNFGLDAVFAVDALVMLCLVPVLLMIVDRPQDRGLRPVGERPGEAAKPDRLSLGYAALTRSPRYWMIALTGCVLAAGGTTMSIHIVPMTTGWGFEPSRAALLLSAIGALGIIGSPLFGWITDRIGGLAALALNAAGQSLLWMLILMQPSFPAMLLITAGLGLTAGGMIASLNATFSEYFGAESFRHAYGLFALCNLPFSVGAPVLAGHLFAQNGDYAIPFAGQIAAYLLVAALGAALTYRASARRSVKISPSA